MTDFGSSVGQRRERLRAEDPELSVRKAAGRIGVHPPYLS